MRTAAVTVVMLLGIAAGARAENPQQLDFIAWKAIPVFHGGRRMPLDTFARTMVRQICGRERPKLDPAAAVKGSLAEKGASAALTALFPDGKPRRFDSAELLLSWLVEPEKWEWMPFLPARHGELRKDLLDVPLTGTGGRKLKHVSPSQLMDAEDFWSRIEKTQEKQEAEEDQDEELNEKVSELYVSLNRYRHLTFNPVNPTIERSRFLDKLQEVYVLWEKLHERLSNLDQAPGQGDPLPIGDVDQTMKQVVSVFRNKGSGFSIEDVDPHLTALKKSATELAAEVHSRCRRAFDDPTAEKKDRSELNELNVKTAALAQTCREMHDALFDNGLFDNRRTLRKESLSLRVVPALNAAALRVDRERSDDNDPWLTLRTVLCGSKTFMQDYPQEELNRVRREYAQVQEAYRDRGASDRPQRFAKAMNRFAVALRRLGEKIEPLREKLPVTGDAEDKASMLAETVYPPDGYVDAELHYNRLDPFLWSWIICLLSTFCFALSFGVLRKPLFWLGIAAIVAAQAMTVYGLGLRGVITGWVPVTNMFETIVFVGFSVAMFGTWLAMTPLLLPGMKVAWQMAAAPKPIRCVVTGGWLRETPVSNGEDHAEGGRFAAGSGAVANYILFLPQIALVAWGFWALCVADYGSGGENPIFRIWPKTMADTWIPLSFGAVMTWAAGMCMLVPTLLLGPRAVVSAVLSLVAVPRAWADLGITEPLREISQRKLYVMVGAAVGCLFLLLAYNWPAEKQSMGGMAAVIRDNFWLSVHVLSITASYGAAALAWGMANIALLFYLFGRYGRTDDAKGGTTVVRPPEVCATLAGFTYVAIKVAVLLLAVGTILGALWADFAWGRFWSWDAKEVWSLISLLAYSVILHSRYAGWSGNFGFSVAAVLGATSIAMAWYGVNYVLGSGLHSYGSGSGGMWYVIAGGICNWVFLLIAAVRYNVLIASSDGS